MLSRCPAMENFCFCVNRIIKICFYFTLSLLLNFDSQAQSKSSEIITDRPLISKSVFLVPVNDIQFEFGFEYQRQKIYKNNFTEEHENLILGNTQIRHGLSEVVELRIGAEYFTGRVLNSGIENISKGIRGVFVGSKVQLRKNQDIISDAALIINVNLPNGNVNLRPKEMEPGFIVAVSQNLGKGNLVCANIGGQRNSTIGKFEYIFAAFLIYKVVERTVLFLEFYDKTEKYFLKNPITDLGLTYLLKNNLQVDFSIGGLLFSEQKNIYGKIGFSIRFPD